MTSSECTACSLHDIVLTGGAPFGSSGGLAEFHQFAAHPEGNLPPSQDVHTTQMTSSSTGTNYDSAEGDGGGAGNHDLTGEAVESELQRQYRTNLESLRQSKGDAARRELELEQLDVTYADGRKTTLGCSHYLRKNKLRAECCGLFVTCRLCHDEKIGDHHVMDRHQVRIVMCMVCGTQQNVGPKCENPECEVEEFAEYFCAECRLYDSSGQAVYHCAECGLCRKGTREENFHCMTCNACVNLASKDRHRCMSQSLHVDCPICKEFLFTSRRPVVFMRCGHTMHSDCWDAYTKIKYVCPLCKKPLTSMDSYYRELDRVMAAELANMPPELRDRKTRIFCNDCERTSEAPFHFENHRCDLILENGEPCLSYNTRVD